MSTNASRWQRFSRQDTVCNANTLITMDKYTPNSGEHVFEDRTGAAAIDAMAAAYRQESAAIARRFAAIGELDALRAQGLAESIFWRTHPYELIPEATQYSVASLSFTSQHVIGKSSEQK